MSPSMRREWIEIEKCARAYEKAESPSMRREWIEITTKLLAKEKSAVSLHAEGVD